MYTFLFVSCLISALKRSSTTPESNPNGTKFYLKSQIHSFDTANDFLARVVDFCMDFEKSIQKYKEQEIPALINLGFITSLTLIHCHITRNPCLYKSWFYFNFHSKSIGYILDFIASLTLVHYFFKRTLKYFKGSRIKRNKRLITFTFAIEPFILSGL